MTQPPATTTVSVNGKREHVTTESDTALLYVLRNHLGLRGTRFGSAGLDVSRIHMVAASTGVSPDEGYTAGSLPIQHSDAALRMAAAEARAAHLDVAADRWGVSVDVLVVVDGTISAPGGRTATYWELTNDALLDRPVTGLVQPKPAAGYRLVGANVARIDLPDKLAPRPRFAHDLALPGMVYGRIVRPPSRGATLRSVDTAPILTLAGPDHRPGR